MASVFDRPFAQTGPRRVEIPEGASLAQIVRLAVPDPVLASHVRVQLDGEWIERTDWDFVPEAGACLTLAVRPAGGDSGNKFLRTLLQIAVIAVATWVGGGAGGLIASKFWATAAAASVMVVGNLAINALVPPPQPSLEPGRFDRGYTIEGARNQYDPYGPVTVSFGEVRIFPKFQGLPVQETHGDDTYIRFLLSLGPMPLEIVPGSIKIGETEIETFQGVEIETRLKPNDPPLTLYARDPFAEQVGATLTPEAGWITRTTAVGVTEIIAVIAFPIGLGGKNKKGNDEYASATVAIEYQPVSADPATGAWSSYRASAPLVNDRLAELGENRLRTDPFLDMAALDSGYEQAGASSGPITWRRKESGKPFQREVRFAVPQGQYRVRVRRTDPEIDDGRTANRVQFAQLISIAPTDPNPEPDHAVMAVRIKASDQLSGVVDTLNLVLRRIAPTLDPAILEADEPDLGLVTGDDWTVQAVTARPADAALFAMRGPMVVNPTPDDEIDWPAWAAFARWCRLKGYRFDYGLTGPMSRGDFVRLACAAGRARPVRINGKWSVVIDGPRADGPRQLFTARNVSNFRVVRTFPGEVHALRVRFPNRFEGYREDERVVYFEGYSLDGSEPDTQVATKIEALDLPGVTDPDQVYELARFFGATAMQQTERFSFDCDIEYLVSNYGDLVAIQHPVMVLGLGAGRIVEVETNASDAVIAITLDRTVEMVAGERYGLAWRRVIEPQSGAAAVEVQGAFEVEAVAGETARLVPLVPVAPADGPRPRPNDLVAFGHYGEETARALIKQITPRAGFEATVETVLEAPIRYQAGEGPIPTHNTALVTPPRRRPPSPELVAVNVTPEQIHISLSAPAGYEDRIAAIEASWRLSPEEDAEARWTPLAPLGADSRVISFTPPDPAAEYDFLITAIDGAGRRSDPPLIVSQIAADNVIDAPRNVTAIGAVSVSANGVRQPVLQIAAEPDEDQTLTELVVEIRPSGSTELADFQPLAVLPPDRPNRDVRDIAPGATLDVGFRYRARRGERLIYSAYEIVEDVAIPDELGATEAGGVDEETITEALEAGEILAQTIWEDALDRHDGVRDILQEFGNAGAVTDAARVQALAAAESATEAGNSASAAAGFEASAQTAATAAGESASAASVSAGAAATSANAAGQSASAAAGFSASASTFAGQAEQYATATLELRTEAQTAASNAASSATQAATASNNAAASASLAQDKANTATAMASSATDSAAAASESEARAAQNAVVSATYGASAKQDVKDAEDFFTSDLSALSYNDGAFADWTEEAITGGAVVVWSTVNSPALCTRARFVPTPGRRYRATVVWRYVSGSPGDVTVGFRALNASSGAFVANRWATVEAGASGEWREASYDITATEAMAAESWCPVIRRTGATGRIEVRSLIWRDIDALRAVGQSQITVYSTADEAFAGLLQQVAIGADYAGMRFALQNTGGAVASAINFASQKLGFGLTYDDPSIVIDPLNETIYALSPDRTVKTWEVKTATGQVIERKPDGTVISDNLDGGIQRDGIRPGALGSQGVAFENRHYFLPNNSTTRTAAQATSAFAPLSIETNAIAFPASEWVSVRAGITMKATSDMFGHFNGRIMLVRRATYPTAGQVTTTLAEDTPHFSVAVNGYWSSGNRRDAGKIELRPWVFEIFDNPPQNGGEDPVSIKYQLIVSAENIGGGYFENFNDNNGARRFYGDRAFVHAVEVASGPVGVDVRRSSSAPAALPSPPAVSITPGGNFLQWN
jgi:hypothetical protein